MRRPVKAQCGFQCGQRQLVDADGAALVIHENRDDHAAQPIGGAGARIFCGVIKADVKTD